jgi:hypothetical protein
MMCQELAGVDIPVVIYLPREQQTSEEYLSPEYLLSPKRNRGA